MVANANLSSPSNSNFDKRKDWLFGSLAVGATVAAAYFQQVLFALVPIFCLNQLKSNRSIQVIQPNYENVVVQLNNVENTLEQLAKEVQQLITKSSKQPLLPGQRGRIAIFIDGNNLYYGAIAEKKRIDYQLLMQELTKDAFAVICSFFYTSVARNKPHEMKFLNYLRALGYQVIEKDLIQHKDGSREGNFDSEIMVDLVDFLPSYDTAVLVSGDGDFKPFVNYIKKQKGRVEVFSFSSSTNLSLKQAADKYVDLKTLSIFRQR